MVSLGRGHRYISFLLEGVVDLGKPLRPERLPFTVGIHEEVSSSASPESVDTGWG